MLVSALTSSSPWSAFVFRGVFDYVVQCRALKEEDSLKRPASSYGGRVGIWVQPGFELFFFFIRDETWVQLGFDFWEEFECSRVQSSLNPDSNPGFNLDSTQTQPRFNLGSTHESRLMEPNKNPGFFEPRLNLG